MFFNVYIGGVETPDSQSKSLAVQYEGPRMQWFWSQYGAGDYIVYTLKCLGTCGTGNWTTVCHMQGKGLNSLLIFYHLKYVFILVLLNFYNLILSSYKKKITWKLIG